MALYSLTWITTNLAVGYAPMSYAELASLKEQGIDAIVNLCGEFCDLHEIEQNAGFEVFFLPIPDETAPDMAAMEKGLEWLDEAVYLGKKVLVHCHHGIGRTGTFVTAYLLRRGFSLKKAGKMLKATRANPTNFSQWWLLRKFGKKEGLLTLGEPTLENRNNSDLQAFFTRYEQLLEKADALTSSASSACCAPSGSHPCGQPFQLEFIEALYLHDKVNIALSAESRQMVIERAAEVGKGREEKGPENEPGCPLLQSGACLLHRFRPIRCRLRGQHSKEIDEIDKELADLSREAFLALFGEKIDSLPSAVSCFDTVSGKFIQRYFHFLASRKQRDAKS
jgi:protein-tyrosine phosphatase